MQLSEDGRFLGQVLRPARRVGPLCARRPRRLPQQRFNGGCSRLRRRRAGNYYLYAPRPRRRNPAAGRRRLPRMGQPRLPRWRRASHRRHGIRHRDHPASGHYRRPRQTAMSTPPSAKSTARSASTCLPAPRKSVSSPTPARTPPTSPPTYSPKSSMARDNRGVILTDSASAAAKFSEAIDQTLITLHRQEILRETHEARRARRLRLYRRMRRTPPT